MSYTFHEETYRGCTIRIESDDIDPMNPREWDNIGTMVCWHRNYNLGDEQPDYRSKVWFRQHVTPSVWKAEIERREQEIRANYEEKAKDGFVTPEEQEEADDDLQWDLDNIESDMEDDDELCQRLFDVDHTRLPLYLYDHSGITMSTGKFSCPWDAGQVGFIYCSLEKAQKEYPSFGTTGWDATSPEAHYQGKSLMEWIDFVMKGEVQTYDDYLTGDVVGFIAEDWDGEEIDSCWGFFPDPDGPHSERWAEPIAQAKASIDHHIEKYGETADLNEGEH